LRFSRGTRSLLRQVAAPAEPKRPRVLSPSGRTQAAARAENVMKGPIGMASQCHRRPMRMGNARLGTVPSIALAIGPVRSCSLGRERIWADLEGLASSNCTGGSRGARAHCEEAHRERAEHRPVGTDRQRCQPWRQVKACKRLTPKCTQQSMPIQMAPDVTLVTLRTRLSPVSGL
jgi:hypothetical protein